MGKSGQNNSKGKGKGSAGNGKRGGGGGRHHHKGKPSLPHRHKKIEVTFNGADRHDYLTGFSSRKKERRAFGLAMQKVKDREAKLEERKEQREAQLEKIEDIERNKVALRKGLAGDGAVDQDDDNVASDDDGRDQYEAQHNEQKLKTFKDEHTTHQFGGLVSVTTTFGIPSDDDDDSINSEKEFYSRKKHGAGHVDEAQKRAGDVQNYMAGVKSTMGSKKKTGKHGGKKGQHGASSMKGMGNGATLKMAKKTLAKFKAKGGKGGDDHERGPGGRKGKKRKGRR